MCRWFNSAPRHQVFIFAGVAQLAEQLICNQQVAGSIPVTSSTLIILKLNINGQVPERPNGADCKSAVSDFGGSNPPLPTNKKPKQCLGFLFFKQTINMYPYHNLILKRIRNGELVKIKKATGEFSYIFYFNTFPYTRPIRNHAVYRYKDIIEKFEKEKD